MCEERKLDVGGEVGAIVREIYELTSRLEGLYPGRHFTPDGHMVGSLGEVIAADVYGLELFEASHPVHDGYDCNGNPVQIKATQGDKIGLGDEPEFLIVLQIRPDGSFDEAYNGPGATVWDACGKMQKNGQRQISIAKLKRIAVEVPGEKRIPTRDGLK